MQSTMSGNFSLPEPAETLTLTMADEAEIIVRRHGNANGPRLVLAHGNGFATDAYFPFWRHLLADYDLCLYDQRNHGWNPRHGDIVHHDVPWFATDMDTVLDGIETHFGKKPTAGVFHSISAVTSVRHALECVWRWDALVLFDPPFVMPPMHELHEISQGFELMLAGWSMTRPESFPSPDTLAEQFQASKSLSRWVEGSHALMARAILREDKESGDWKLCCPPAGESRVYATNGSMNLTPYFPDLKGPLKIIASDPDDPNARSPGLVNRALHQLYGHPWEAVPGTTHMLQLEEPEACARIVKEFLSEAGLKS